jgi:hypothetical protein
VHCECVQPILVTGCMVVQVMQRQEIIVAVLCWLWSGHPTPLQQSAGAPLL